MNLKPYPAYKDSGVLWFGEVPEHWEVRRLKQIARLAYGNSLAMESRQQGAVPVFGSNGRVGCHSVSNTKAPCIVIGRKGSFGKVNFSADPVFAIDTTFFVDSRFTSADTRWLFYLLGYLRLDEVSRDSAVPGLDREEAYQRVAALPPLREQSTIVRFLDHVDRRIRRYIRAKQKLIKLLNEQKQAIIHGAVTRGLDPSVRLKPSGVEWLGDVPEYWEVKRLKWVTRLQRGYDLPADRRVPGPFPVVSSGGLIDTHSESRCAGPGVVMGRYGSTDAVFYIEQDFWPHNTSLFVTQFQGNMPKWCYYLLRSITKADHAGKSAVPGVDRKDLFQIVVAVPPVDEQVEIVRSIEAGSRDLNEAISMAQREIALLREYRTRLIADVVTGKLDVREAAARLPDEADEPEALQDTDTPTEGDNDTDDADLDVVPDEAEA